MSALGGDLRPLVMKELRLLARSRFAFWGLFFVLAGIGGGVFMFWVSSGQQLTLNQRAEFARGLFYTVGALLLVFLGLISPMITAVAFTDERERKTFDMLQCTGISPRRLIMGKWLGAMAYQFVLVICLLPILSVVFQFGGVGAQEFLMTAGLVMLTSGTYGMVGLAVSAGQTKSLKSLASALGWVFMLAIGSYLLCCISFIVSPLMAFMFLSMQGGPSGWLIVLHVGFQVLIFLAMLRRAGRELSRPEKLTIFLTREQLTKLHPEMAAWQRRTFPYIVTYPFYIPPPIPDGEDPLYIHEKRQAMRAHFSAMMKLGCAGMLLTAFVPFAYQGRNSGATLSRIMVLSLSYIALVMPVAAATTLTREHEQGTLNLLMNSPISEWGVVWSKFRAALRLMVYAWLIVIFPGLVVEVFLTRDHWGYLLALCKLAPPALAFLALYAAVGVGVSSLCRRNVAALAAALLTAGMLLFSPMLMSGVFFILDVGLNPNTVPSGFEMGPALRIPLSLISPLMMPDLGGYDMYKDWFFVALQTLGILVVAWFLLRGAKWKLARRSAT